MYAIETKNLTKIYKDIKAVANGKPPKVIGKT